MIHCMHHSHKIVHVLKLQLEHRRNQSNVKTVAEIFLQAPCRLCLWVLQSSLMISDHPGTTLQPKYVYSHGSVVCEHSVVGRLLLNIECTQPTCSLKK